jgi:hypothetical protein
MYFILKIYKREELNIDYFNFFLKIYDSLNLNTFWSFENRIPGASRVPLNSYL